MFAPTAVTSEHTDLLQKTKGQLFFNSKAGFLGMLLAKLKFQWTEDLPTAAISEDTLYWNPGFFLSLDKETRVTVLAHELWHNALLHGARISDRCPEIWNIAGDHVINLLLKEHGYYMDGFAYVMDEKYKGWTTDEIYDDLIKPGKPKPQAGTIQVPGIGNDVLPITGDAVSTAVANVVGAKTAAGMSNMAGSMPGEMTMVIDKFLNPKLPWETLLYNYFNALTSQEYSFRRPNRRYDDPIMPGLAPQNGLEHLIYYVDISGSITDEQIVRVNSEVKFIQEELRPERLTLVTFDTEIHDIYNFEMDDEFAYIEITGRGGTDLHEVFKHMQENAPTAAIIFTDLEVGIPSNPGVPIIWICVDNPKKKVPFGTLIHFSE